MQPDNTSARQSARQPRADHKIVLVGMMGAGKTTLGRLASARADWPFVDIDQVVEEEAGCRIAEIFSREGEAAFRRIELETIRRFLDADGPALISAGGGAFCQEAVRDCLRGRATSVFLRVERAELLRRLEKANAGLRPVLGGVGWRERLDELVGRRYPLYEQADMVLDIGDETPEETCRRLLDLLAEGNIRQC